MGFMDKAKKLAEQAQQKLDEAQKNLNQSASPQAEPGSEGVRYDEHGRPVQEAPPAGAPTPSVPAAPAAPEPPADPASPPPPPAPASEPDPAAAESAPAGPEPTRRPQTGESGGDQANAAPDPFKPLQQ